MFPLPVLKKYSGCCFLLLGWLLMASPAVSAPAAGDFEAANRLYEQGRFVEAAAAYESLLQGGFTSPALLFNLGNAHFKAGHIGRAIAAYHEAADISPRDADIRANLQFARNKVQGPTRSRSRIETWLSTLSLNEWTMVTAAVVWVGFGLLVAGQLRPSLKTALRPWLWAAAGGGLFVAVCLGGSWHYQKSRTAAVVVANGTQVHKGPFADSEAASVINDGAEVLVLDRKNDWVQVALNPRQSGWIQNGKLRLLR